MSDYTMKRHKEAIREDIRYPNQPSRWLGWRPCVGRRLAHRDCRIYTNRRWGIKVTAHVRTLGQWDLTVADPWSIRRWAEREQRFAQDRVRTLVTRFYTQQQIAEILGEHGHGK